METTRERLCKFCNEARAKYNCPRCNFAYCSTDCYRDPQHRNCSEDFYREWVQTCLGTERADPKARRQVEEILRSVHKDAECEPLAERLQRIDLQSGSSIWDQLTEEERSEFYELLRSGELGKYVPVWRPWWEEDAGLVVEITDESPAGPLAVQPLSKLTSRLPAPCVVNSVLNVLCSYVYVAKLYNGDLTAESVADLLGVCAVLDRDAVFGTVGEAVQSVCQRIVAGGGGTPTETSPQLLRSFKGLIGGPRAKTNATRALNEIHKLLEDSAGISGGDKETKKKIRRAVKKCEYLCSWTTERGDVLSSCTREVDVELASVVEEAASYAEAEEAVKEQLKKESGKKVLIEEI